MPSVVKPRASYISLALRTPTVAQFRLLDHSSSATRVRRPPIDFPTALLIARSLDGFRSVVRRGMRREKYWGFRWNRRRCSSIKIGP